MRRNLPVFVLLGLVAFLILTTKNPIQAAICQYVQVDFLDCFDVTASSVVVGLQELARLETVQLTVHTTQQVEGDSFLSDITFDLFARDKITIVGIGEVIAGVDLKKIAADSVYVDGRSVSIVLPEPEIFAARLDNQKSQVIVSDSILDIDDDDLETKARIKAESAILAEAQAQDILPVAEENGKKALREFLLQLGFEEVFFPPNLIPPNNENND